MERLTENWICTCKKRRDCTRPIFWDISNAQDYTIFRNEGWAGIYSDSGLKPTLVMSIPNTVIYLTACDDISVQLRRLHTLNTDDHATSSSYMIPLLAGSAARIISSFATIHRRWSYVIRTRQASISQEKATSILEDFRFLTRNGGLTSCYKGLGPLLLLDAPFAAIYFLCLEQFRESLFDKSLLMGYANVFMILILSRLVQRWF